MKLFFIFLYGFFVFQYNGIPFYFFLSLGLFFFLLTKKIKFNRPIFLLFFPLVYIIIYSLFLLVFSNNYTYNITKEILILIIFIITALIISSEIKKDETKFLKSIVFLIYFIFATLVIDLLINIYLNQSLISFFDPLDNNYRFNNNVLNIFGFSTRRLYGLSSEPQRLAIIINILILIKIFSQEEYNLKSYLLDIFIILITQFGTYSITVVPLTLINIFFITSKIQYFKLRHLSLIFIFLIFILSNLTGEMSILINAIERKISFDSPIFLARFNNYASALTLSFQHFFLGGGIDIYNEIYGRNTGNMFLLFLVEGGIIPFIFYIYLNFKSSKTILINSSYKFNFINYSLLVLFFFITQSFQSEIYNILLYLHIIYGLSITRKYEKSK